MRLAGITALLDGWYDPSWAEPWDRVGLVCGDPEQEVRRVLFAVDPVEAVVEEALDLGADLLVVHHPLLLTPVSTIAATTAKGRALHRLVRGGTALFTAHTNADVPADGTNDALAGVLGLRDTRVLVPTGDTEGDEGLDKLVVLVPVTHADQVREAVTAAGAGAIGAYDSCSFTVRGEGRFRPLPGAEPVLGQVGGLEVVEECRVEAVLRRGLRHEVVTALRAAHPYEEPAFDLVELVDTGPPRTVAAGGPAAGRADDPAPGARGHGRVGTLPGTVRLGDLAATVAGVLPPTAHGVRVAGDLDRPVRTVAVGAGSGESLLEQARRSGADVYVTSDLKHHRAGEFLEDGGPALLDVAHWAAEWPWLPVVAEKVARAVREEGDTVVTRVSTLVTDPWTSRA
ncbi:MAG: GTP cyclohydrolase 1 type 2 homolog YbgI [uncultured Nocardioidaceae bacterium]|uniref:GTP cyclohydrolase 1 type 2 homolog n=1 Tax=uncultured Nocardioidaceae bacterium TaxID=253824 RepID=A0A6J4MKZ1_9ACTN|nr:MAG: GTP cyclohydrolase 1 type 2 homolog YbgI [uncultured Nocardioidaceae bacterium]